MIVPMQLDGFGEVGAPAAARSSSDLTRATLRLSSRGGLNKGRMAPHGIELR